MEGQDLTTRQPNSSIDGASALASFNRYVREVVNPVLRGNYCVQLLEATKTSYDPCAGGFVITTGSLQALHGDLRDQRTVHADSPAVRRSEERRVGKECRSRW